MGGQAGGAYTGAGFGRGGGGMPEASVTGSAMAPIDAGGMPPWSYKPPAPGVADSKPAFDLKSPLAKFAMDMALQNLAPKSGAMGAAPPMMGMQHPMTPPKSPYGINSLPYQAKPLGRLS